jgi:hypothetical protein
MSKFLIHCLFNNSYGLQMSLAEFENLLEVNIINHHTVRCLCCEKSVALLY